VTVVDLLVSGLAALLTSCLPLFSGLGLGTVLMAVFALFSTAPLAGAIGDCGDSRSQDWHGITGMIS
jgi:hypothetical protein